MKIILLNDEEYALELYAVFIFMAVVTIMSPGPGVLKSLTNSLNYGLKPAIIGIGGLTCGVFLVAVLSATSLGLIISASATAFKIIRFIGAAYLIYLGIKLWRAPAGQLHQDGLAVKNKRGLFCEGILLQLSNPNALLFFLSVLPQFIDHSRAYLPQFLLLVMTFCALMVLVHGSYAVLAHRAKRWISGGGGRLLNQIGAVLFIVLGIFLALAGQH